MTLDDLYQQVLVITSEFHVDPSVPIESEEFFGSIIESFQGSKEECLAYIRREMPKWFKRIKQPPSWIQGAEWQFRDGKPLVFVGQIDVPFSGEWFHDDTNFYLFWNPQDGETKVVIQSA